MKVEKYAELATRYRLILIAIKTLVLVGAEAIYFFQELSRRIVAVTVEPRSMAFLRQRLSVAVQRGNASCIAGTEQWNDDETLYV